MAMDTRLGKLPIFDEDREFLRKRRLLLTALAAFLLSLAIFGGLRAFFTQIETGSWECQYGEWVQRGRPSTPPPPTADCQGSSVGPVPQPRAIQNAVVNEAAVPLEAARFFDRGRLVRGLPGLEPGQLYLAYDRLGIGVDKVPIHYVEISICTIGEQVVACQDPRIDNGVRVDVRGSMHQRRIYVTELHVLEPGDY